MKRPEIIAALKEAGIPFKATSKNEVLMELLAGGQTKPASKKSSGSGRYFVVLKQGSPFRSVGIADFTLTVEKGKGDVRREISEEVARSIEPLFKARVLPELLQDFLVVEGLD